MATRGERRPVTVLFADLAGYTRLSTTLDPEEVHRLLERFFEAVDGVVHRYGGTIDKHIGDNVMAIFGAPTAHDNDPERAVRTAGEIHACVKHLSEELGVAIAVHIGIASGQVMASDLGSAHHQEYTVTGDTVNLAARLQDKATAGETFVSDTVRTATRGVARYEPVGEVMLKGLPAPVPVWKLSGLSDLPGEATSSFVGRRAELRQLTLALDECLEHGQGTTLVVRGEAGIGKTRLVAEVRDRARALGFGAHVALAVDFGAGGRSDPIRTLVLGLLGAEPTSALADCERACESAVAAGLVERDDVPFLFDVVDVPQPAASRARYEAMDGEARSQGKRRALAALVRNAARARPLLLVVENAEWVPAKSVGLLGALSSAAGECRAVAICTCRLTAEESETDWLAALRRGPVLTLDLGALRKEDALELAAGFSGTRGDVLEECVKRAAGNPLFLEQLLSAAQETGAPTVPHTIHSLVLSRVDRLPETDRLALQVASVLGLRFSLDPVRAIGGLPDYAAHALVAHRLVRPEGGDYLFQHALVQEGVYAALTRARRRELHLLAAEWFQGTDLVLHAEHLGRAEDPTAARAYLAAADAEAEACHFDSAIWLLERGYAAANEATDRHAIAMRQGDLRRTVGYGRDAAEAYQRALSAAGDDLERCRALIGVAAGNRLVSAFEPMMAALDAAEPLARALSLTRELSQIHYLRGSGTFVRGAHAVSRRYQEQALELAERANDPELTARALSGLADAEYAQGNIVAAGEHFQRCLALCEAHGLTRFSVPNLAMAAHIEWYFLRLDEALAVGRRAVAIARELGELHSEMFAVQSMAFALTLLGRSAEAEGAARSALSLAQRLGIVRYESQLDALLAEQRLLQGARAEAEELAARAVALARESGLAFCGPMVLGVRAWVTSDPVARRAAIDEGERLLATGEALAFNHNLFRRAAIEAELGAGDLDEVERHAAELEKAMPGLPITAFIVDRARALSAYRRDPGREGTRAAIRDLRARARAASLTTELPDVGD